MIRTGIFGGSFNPIHNGHILLARQLKERARLDEVWLMVSPQNPLKKGDDLLDDDKRMEMARMAVADEKGIIASDYEMHLPKPSYTWNTLEALKRDYPDREFVLMIGGDNWELFDKWYRADDIKANYEVVVYTRTPGDEGFIDISSTDIRQRVKAGRSIRSLVPKAVADFIKKNGYYA
ncbi:nicotinate (nicotinamide) nucleotide adenylyltransferase [Prevotella sp. FD3004]|jgi:nicotinate-nucleotide adenylyltransferase|uniref:nicotinate (nicotinamide) nucleotide adenylyltransferase n=1 Tax=Prevotella sp. FD3004 TaxID=1408309 RepID=UPI00056BFCBB|nr:nicotinate (nicotinamide) nucleotide adenylyltransferase [Prevotella sp. FD3004]